MGIFYYFKSKFAPKKKYFLVQPINAFSIFSLLFELIYFQVLMVDLPNYGVPSKRFDGRCNNVVTSLNIEVVYASIGIIIIIIETIIILSLLSKVYR